MRLPVRPSAAVVVIAVLGLFVAIPGLGSAAPESKDVIVKNGPDQPVPVIGTVSVDNTPAVTVAGTPTVNVGNTPAVTVAGTPTVQVANEPFQQLFAKASSGSGEDCDELEVPDGRAVMLQNVSVEARVFGSDADLRPNVYLLILQNSNSVRFPGELFERRPDVWGGFWDVDILVQPGLSDVQMCAQGGLGETELRGFATGYFLF